MTITGNSIHAFYDDVLLENIRQAEQASLFSYPRRLLHIHRIIQEFYNRRQKPDVMMRVLRMAEAARTATNSSKDDYQALCGEMFLSDDPFGHDI